VVTSSDTNIVEFEVLPPFPGDNEDNDSVGLVVNQFQAMLGLPQSTLMHGEVTRFLNPSYTLGVEYGGSVVPPTLRVWLLHDSPCCTRHTVSPPKIKFSSMLDFTSSGTQQVEISNEGASVLYISKIEQVGREMCTCGGCLNFVDVPTSPLSLPLPPSPNRKKRLFLGCRSPRRL